MKQFLDPGRVIELINQEAWLKLKAYAKEAYAESITYELGGNKELARRRAALKYLKSSDVPGMYLGKTWIVNGDQIFTDKRSAFIFSEGYHISGLPQVIPDVDCDVRDVSQYFVDANYATTETPVAKSSLKTAVMDWKADGKQTRVCRYVVGNAGYDAARLLNVLEILGTDEAIIRQRSDDCAQLLAHIVMDGRSAVVAPYDKE